jgi:hypothetical protein
MSFGAHTTAARCPSRLMSSKSAGLSRSLQAEQHKVAVSTSGHGTHDGIEVGYNAQVSSC